MKTLKFKALIVASALSLLFLSGCTTTVVGGPGSNTCYVHDLAGRSWNWTSYGNACAGAIRACQNWHANHGIYNGRCMIQ